MNPLNRPIKLHRSSPTLFLHPTVRASVEDVMDNRLWESLKPKFRRHLHQTIVRHILGGR